MHDVGDVKRIEYYMSKNVTNIEFLCFIKEIGKDDYFFFR